MDGATRCLLPVNIQVKEYIDRRRGCKQNVSSKGLQQVGGEIDRPDSGLDETLLAYQAWVSTGRRCGKSYLGIMYSNSARDGRTTWSELDHVEGSAPH